MLACPSPSLFQPKGWLKRIQMVNMHSMSAPGFSLLNKLPHLILKYLIQEVGISIISGFYSYFQGRWISLNNVTMLVGGGEKI